MAIKAANDKSMSNITALPSGVSAKSMILLATETASSSSTINFTSGIDSTYKEYIFKCYDIHPANNGVFFTVGFRDGSTAYDATKTTTYFRAYHNEAGNDTALEYTAGSDLAQGTGFQYLSDDLGNDNDQSCSGELWLFSPSSSVFVKHYISRVSYNEKDNFSMDAFSAGYFNTTTALTRVQFKQSSGDIDAGTIKLYGIV